MCWLELCNKANVNIQSGYVKCKRLKFYNRIMFKNVEWPWTCNDYENGYSNSGSMDTDHKIQSESGTCSLLDSQHSNIGMATKCCSKIFVIALQSCLEEGCFLESINEQLPHLTIYSLKLKSQLKTSFTFHMNSLELPLIFIFKTITYIWLGQSKKNTHKIHIEWN